MRPAVHATTANGMIRRLHLALIGACLLVGVWPGAVSGGTSTTPDPANLERADRWIADQIDRTDTPGAAWAIIHQDEVVLRQVAGTDGDGNAITPRTPFLLGSISKSVTALAVMQLVEDGRVELDAPVQRYLPWLELADANATTRITIEHLLMHTSGIAESDGLAAADRFDNAPGGVERTVRELAGIELVHDPGVAHEYSSANYMILGAVVEAVSGLSFADYLQRNILDPLDMTDAIATDAQVQARNLPAGHRYAFMQPDAFDSAYDASGVPYGYLGGSIEDVSHYTIAQLDQGRYRSASVLSPESIAASQTGPGEPSSRNYAYGWRDDELAETGTRMVWHTGATPGYNAIIVMLPELDLAVVVLQNASSPLRAGELNAAGFGAATILAGGDPEIPSPDSLYRNILLAGVAVLAGASITGIWALVRLFRRPASPTRARSRRRVVTETMLWVLGAGALAAVFGIAVPRAFGADLRSVRLFTPDIGQLIVAIVVVSLALATVRLAIGIRAFRMARG